MALAFLHPIRCPRLHRCRHRKIAKIEFWHNGTFIKTVHCFSCFRRELFQLCESPLQIRSLYRAQLQVQEGRQSCSDPEVNPARVDIRDQPRYRVAHRDRVVQGRQRIRVFAGSMAIAPAPDAAQFGSLVGVGVKKT